MRKLLMQFHVAYKIKESLNSGRAGFKRFFIDLIVIIEYYIDDTKMIYLQKNVSEYMRRRI
jgi:hypothetical protein